MVVKREYNMGTMTASQKNGMIVHSLRKQSMYWKPIQQCKKNALVRRDRIYTERLYYSPTKTMPIRELDYVMLNMYECNICKEIVPEKTFTFKQGIFPSGLLQGNRTFNIVLKNNLAVDHINPVVTSAGFKNWTDFIDRLFDEDINNYQLLCKECHKDLTKKENNKRKLINK